MSRRFLFLAAVAVSLVAASASQAQIYDPRRATSDGNPQPVADMSYRTSWTITVGAADLTTVSRVVVSKCSTTGDVVIKHKDGTTITVTISQTGTAYWPEQAVGIVTSGTTATCTYKGEL